MQLYIEEAKKFAISMLSSEDNSESLNPKAMQTSNPLSKVFQFCEELYSAVKDQDMSLCEVLTFMRCGIKVDGNPAIAIWTSRAISHTSLTLQAVNSAVRASQLGKTQDKRDFLRSGSTDTVIVRNENTARQSSITLNLNDPRWPPALLEKLKRG